MKEHKKFIQKWQRVIIVLIFWTMHISYSVLYIYTNLPQIVWDYANRPSDYYLSGGRRDYFEWLSQSLENNWYIIALALIMPIITFFVYKKVNKEAFNPFIIFFPYIFAFLLGLIDGVCKSFVHIEDPVILAFGIIFPISVFVFYISKYYQCFKKEINAVTEKYYPFGFGYLLDEIKLMDSLKNNLPKLINEEKIIYKSHNSYRLCIDSLTNKILERIEIEVKIWYNGRRIEFFLKDKDLYRHIIHEVRYDRYLNIKDCISAIKYEKKKNEILSNLCMSIFKDHRLINYIQEHELELSAFIETHKEYISSSMCYNISVYDFKRNLEKAKYKKEAKDEWLLYLDHNKVKILEEIGKYRDIKGMSIDTLKSLDSIYDYRDTISKAQKKEEKRLQKKQEELRQQIEQEEQKRKEEEHRKWLSNNVMSIVNNFNSVAHKPAMLYLTPDEYKYSRTDIEGLSKADYELCKLLVEDNTHEYDKFRSRFTETISDVPFVYLWNYIPKDVRMVDIEDAEKSRLILSFKDGGNIEKVSNEVITKLKELFRDIVLKKKDGTKHTIQLSDYYLVCIPPSTQARYERRFQAFSSEVSKKCGIKSEFERIVVESGVTPGHLGGDIRPRLNIDTKWFQGKKIVLFDDIVTRGDTMRYYIDVLRRLGADIVCCMSLGKTKH